MIRQPSLQLAFAQGSALSAPVFLRGPAFNRVLLSAGFEGATVAVHIAPGDNTPTPADAAFLPLKDAQGDAVRFPVDPAAAVSVVPAPLDGCGWMRLVASQAQTAARTATLLFPVRG